LSVFVGSEQTDIRLSVWGRVQTPTLLPILFSLSNSSCVGVVSKCGHGGRRCVAGGRAGGRRTPGRSWPPPRTTSTMAKSKHRGQRREKMWGVRGCISCHLQMGQERTCADRKGCPRSSDSLQKPPRFELALGRVGRCSSFWVWVRALGAAFTQPDARGCLGWVWVSH
jgi:hypothetical protein